MKKIILALALLLLAFGLATPQRSSTAQKKPTVKQVQLTSQMIARRPAGKAYAVDLTRKGTIYTLAPGMDYSRVQIHTSKGDMTVADLLQKSGKKVTGSLRIGMTADLRTVKFNLGNRGGIVGGVVRFNPSTDCGPLACTCSGYDDCIEMFDGSVCGPIAACDGDNCFCLRI